MIDFRAIEVAAREAPPGPVRSDGARILDDRGRCIAVCEGPEAHVHARAIAIALRFLAEAEALDERGTLAVRTEELKREADELEREVSRLEDQIDDLETERDQLSDEARTIERKIDDTERRLGEAESRLRSIDLEDP